MVTISFEDGDGNIGLENTDTDFPFHNNDFFIGENGATNAIPTKSYGISNNYLIPGDANGKLILYRTRKNPAYSSLPAYSCVNWLITTAYVDVEREELIPDDVERTLTNTTGLPAVYAVTDTFLIQPNPNYYNMEVKFFRKPTPSSNYEEFDWVQYTCQPFSGRIPTLPTENAVSGTITYSMVSAGFADVMSSGIWQVQIKIRDRAFNESNVVSSNGNTLQEITRSPG